MWKMVRTVLLFVIIAGFAGGITFVSTVASEAPALSDVNVTPEGYLTTVLDQNGDTLVTLAGTEANRIYVDLEMIPTSVQQAFIAIEDARFYSHHGIDVRGIGRALLRGIQNGFHFSEGASTITQQLLKNNVFSGWTSEQTFYDKLTRKIQEQYLAVKLESVKSKETILEYYLNTINLGGGTWGVQAASKRYFGKDVSALTLSEASVIAGITKNPSAYNPLNHPEECRERQELVLKAMEEQGYITADEREEALADDVFGRIETNHTDATAEVLSYFEDTLVQQILHDLMNQLGYTEEEAWDAIYRGGLTIWSTCDQRLQTIAEEEMSNDSNYNNDAQASMVILDVKTGAVRALVGGRGEKTASLVFNRAVDSLRQPGSTIKVIGEYAAALENGQITLGTTLDDAAYSYSNGDSISNADKNYRGQTTVRTSIAKSLNIPAVKVFQQVGMDDVWNQLLRFGITTLTDADKVEALSLGGTNGGVTNLQMTAAYNAIANNGTYVKPYYYTKVIDHDGRVILEVKNESMQAVSSGTAALLTSAMEEVLTTGTGTQAYFEGYALAGKSGTTTGSRDIWFVGYSTDLTCGVWGGYDDNQKQSSGGYVRTLWKAVMKRAAEVTGAGQTFASLQSLEKAVICTKCGLLAVDGLCSESLQGNMTATEYYAPGTAPGASCSCHVKREICTDSNQPCSSYCPSSSRKTVVYLKSGTEGTDDASYVAPADSGTCGQHVYFWNQWSWGNSDGSEEPENDTGNDGTWWDSFREWFR